MLKCPLCGHYYYSEPVKVTMVDANYKRDVKYEYTCESCKNILSFSRALKNRLDFS